jgi:hypothetical protein
MNVYLEPIFHIVEMDTNWIEYIYYIILVEKSHWVLGCYQTQKLLSCRSIQLVSKIMFKISGFFQKKKNHINLIVEVKSIGGLIGNKWHN